jgi:diguanylate cyclase (GGDEF)-like protein/PAS domain S-box-containing protein
MIDTSNRKTENHRMDHAEGILENLPLGLITFTADLRVHYTNAAIDKLLDRPHRTLPGTSLEKILPMTWLRERIHEVMASGCSQYAIALELPDAVRCEITLVPIISGARDASNASAGVRLLMILEDISKRRHFRQSFRASDIRTARMNEETEDFPAMSKLSSAIQQTADSVVITDSEGTIEFVNPAFERLTGYCHAEAVGNRPSLVRSGRHSEEFYKKLWHTIRNGHVFTGIFVNQTKHGTLYYEDITITPLRDARGQITHFVSTGKDVTERMMAEQHLDHLAHHDALTDLPNRTLFIDRFKQALGRAVRHDLQVAVLFLDLDRFKLINDTLGHDAGDLLLRAVAGRLTGHIRTVDSLARYGGDEFAVLMEDVAGDQAMPAIAQNMLDALKAPFVIDGCEIHITTSIGISLYPDDGCDPQTLLKNADTAMYRAKAQGKNTFCFYTTDMNAKASERLTLEKSLRYALDREEFVLHYQPQIDIKSGRIICLEALLRWRHPELGLLAPEKFVPHLEESGLILDVGEWILQDALGQMSVWRQHGHRDLRLAVNLSPVQIRDAGFVSRIGRKLHAYSGQDAHLLEFEITECLLKKHLPETVGRLHALNAFGARLSLDDFGPECSSLAYLTRIPFETVKLDRSLVGNINADPDDTAIIGAMIAMMHNLKMNVVAEGVETVTQLDCLREQGCDAIQGHLFSAAMTAEEVTALLLVSPERSF